MNKIIHRLRKISLFSNFKDDATAMNAIATVISAKTVKPKTYIIREGESGDSMYILNSGTVRVEKQTLSNDKFTVVNLSDDMNVFFGEVALMDNDVRSASVIALSQVECFEIRKTDFEKLCASNPKIGYYVIREIARSLAARLRKTTTDSATLIAALIHEDEVVC